MNTIQWSELVWGGASLLLIMLYHAYWIRQVKHAPLKTYLGVTKHLRRLWVESIMKERRDILAVQTLRNWIMAANFLASTAIIIGLGVFSFWFKPDHLKELPFDFTLIFSHGQTLFIVKLMILVMDCFFAFYSFTLSIRYMNHINFMINVPLDECDPVLSVDYLSHMLDLGMLHYTIGMRAYYLAVIFTLWLFGPQWMFLGTVVVLIFLYKLDHCCPVDSPSQCDIMHGHMKGRQK